jgi:type VI secretion system protein ImpK
VTSAPLPQQASQPISRTNSLALSFQDVITVVLRMRYGSQRVADAAGFRASIRKMIAAAVQEVRTLGYSDASSHMALYAIIGFLDESVLNSQDPTFADWSRRPLQEEMFGGHFAGETFFRQVTDLLNAPESSEVADVLELHAICLLLGYRGKYAFGDHGEIHGILSRIREKILRIRGPLAIARLAAVPEIKLAAKRDKWLTTFWVTAAALAILTIALFAIYTLTLGSGLGAIQSATLLLPSLALRRKFSLHHPHKSVILSEAEGPAVALPKSHSTSRHLDRSEAQWRDPCSLLSFTNCNICHPERSRRTCISPLPVLPQTATTSRRLA